MAVLSTSANVATPGIPVGSIQAFAGANPPIGWLLCDGSAVSRGNYPDLYNVLGTTYGSGDGSTTFNLPDLRGRVPAGKDNMGGTAASRLTSGNSGITGTNLGANGGDERLHQHTHVQNAHTHIQNAHGHDLGGGQSFGMSFGPNAGGIATFGVSVAIINTNTYQGPYSATNTTATNQNTTATNQNTGSGASQNVQPTLIVNYIIKAIADIARGGWYTQSSPPVVTQLPSNPAIGDEVYHLIAGSLYNKRWDGTQWQSVANDLIADQVTYDKVASSQTNWVQNTPAVTTVNTATPTVIATATITLRGRGPVLVVTSGDANPTSANDWNYIAIYIDGVQQTPYIVCLGAAASGNTPFALTRMFSGLSAGSHTFTIRAWQGQGTMVYGEVGTVNAPSLVVVELF